MIRSELVQKLCGDFPDLTQREVEGVVGALFDSITDQLAKGGRVELRVLRLRRDHQEQVVVTLELRGVEVGAEAEGLLEVGTAEGVVDHQGGPVGVGQLGDGADVGQAHPAGMLARLEARTLVGDLHEQSALPREDGQPGVGGGPPENIDFSSRSVAGIDVSKPSLGAITPSLLHQMRDALAGEAA